jgi:hypothetical protein
VSGVDWTVRVRPMGCGQWAFFAGTRAGYGYPSQKEAQEAGEAAALAACKPKEGV